MMCPKCAAPVAPVALFCSACGAPIPKAQSPKRSLGSQLARGVVYAFLGIGGCILCLAVFGTLLKHGAGASGSATPEMEQHYGDTVSRRSARGITLAAYMQIQSGMTYEQVQEIIGTDGVEISRSNIAGYSTVMYSWKSWNGSNMNAMFQNDQLVTKAQFGLR
jgi:hypothetical protein